MQVKIGDLVKARHWGTGYLGLVVAVRRLPSGEDSEICTVMINGDSKYLIDQLIRDLEVINESR